MRRARIAICLLAAGIAQASADSVLAAPPLGKLLGSALARRLEAAPTLSHVVPADGAPGWLPAVTSRTSILAEVSALRPSIVVEVLRLFNGLGDRLAGTQGRLALYNALHAVSTMEGITYWSASRGRERVLFTLSYAVASASNPTRVADPVFAEIPEVGDLLSLQADQTFGKHLYRSTYLNQADHLVVKTENVDAISWLFIPVTAPGNLSTISVLVPVSDGLLYAAVSYMKANILLPGRGGQEASLVNRLIAVSSWLGRQLGARQ